MKSVNIANSIPFLIPTWYFILKCFLPRYLKSYCSWLTQIQLASVTAPSVACHRVNMNSHVWMASSHLGTRGNCHHLALPGRSYSWNSHFKFQNTNLHKMYDLLTVKIKPLSRIPYPEGRKWEGGDRDNLGRGKAESKGERAIKTVSTPLSKNGYWRLDS